MSDPFTVRQCINITCCISFNICILPYSIGVLIVVFILGGYLTGPLVFILIPVFIFLGCLPFCIVFGCIYVFKKMCTSCCSEDVPSQETAPVECPPPVQRDEQTAVTIELEEKGGPTAKLGNPTPAQATPPPDKPETQGDLTTAVPPPYQVHIQPRWLGNHHKVISTSL